MSSRGDPDAADSLFLEAIEIDRRGDDPATLASHLDQYGIALWRAARYEKAQRVQEEALAMRRTLYGDEHTLVATSLLNLAATVLERGDYAQVPGSITPSP